MTEDQHYAITPEIAAEIEEVVARQSAAFKAIGDPFHCPDCGTLPGPQHPRPLLFHLATCDKYLAAMGAPHLPLHKP